MSMKNSVIFFFLGMLLTLLSIVFKIVHWANGRMVFIAGMLCIAIALFLLIKNILLKPNSNNPNK